MPPLFIFLGPPGSGKGTQARKLQAESGLTYLATGDIVREMSERAGSGDAFYDEIKVRKDAGIPQPDGVIIEMVERKLRELDLTEGVIFDSFPLSRGQAEWLEKKRQNFSLGIPKVIFISLSEKDAVSRLSRRKHCPQCHRSFLPDTRDYENNQCPVCGQKLIIRNDDTAKVVARRYQEYTKRLKDVVDFYREKKWLSIIHGDASVNEVAERIKREVLV